MTTLEYALAYLGAGISVIPIRLDGSKAPEPSLLPRVWDAEAVRAHPSWAPFQERPPAEEDARRWWGRDRPPGIAAVCGAVSGGLELLDFDRGPAGQEASLLYEEWLRLVEAEAPGLVARQAVVLTPRRPSGVHVWFRCADHDVPGNQKLAVDPSAPAGQRTLIETRGEGGYALLPGCPPACHGTGGRYEPWSGSLLDLRPISIDEREVLVRCARGLTREAQEEAPPNHDRAGGGLRPGSDFDASNVDWAEILTPHGWACVAGGPAGERRWRRPGKDGPGWSATTGHCRGRDGADLLRMFSSNAEPFADGKAYGKFRALSLLEFGGDWSACAKALAARGYGERRGGAALVRPSESQLRMVLAVCAAHPDLVLRQLLAWDGARECVRRLLQGGDDGGR